MAKKQTISRIKKQTSKFPTKSKVTRIPASLSIFIRDNTDWDKFLKVLTDLAYGGVNQMTYNGNMYVTSPNLDALRMMAEFSYGKPKESTDITINTKDVASKLAEIISQDMNA